MAPGEVFGGALEGEGLRAAAHESEVGEDDLRMFAVDPDGKLYVYGSGESFTPKAGWTVIVLGDPTGELEPAPTMASERPAVPGPAAVTA